MKIVHIYWNLRFGGIETMLVNIANAQSELNQKVSIIIINDWIENSLLESINKNINVILLKRRPGSKNLFWILKLNLTLQKIKPDVIHLHASKLFNLILKKFKQKTCSTLHDIPSGLTKRKGFFSKIIALPDNSGNVSFIDIIPINFSISKVVYNELLKNYNLNSIIVNNGIITKNFKVKNFNKISTKFKIINVSRLEHTKKGQDLLIKAAAKINYPIEVYFVGIGESELFLKDLTKQLHVENKIYFLGKQTQDWIANNLCNYKLFVQPSRFEGFGLTVAEALAANVPVLVSYGQGPAEICQDDKFGYVFENNNVDDLVTKIEYIINNYEQAKQKTTNGRNNVIKNYDVSATALKYIEEYKKFTARTNS